jgi:formylglycine-generating enzyme required for sulfatase activity/CRP-like cAMP-binding protein/chromosome segregation ATPase
MGAAIKLIDKKMLRDLVPINALSAVHVEEISRKAVIEEVSSGRYVFKTGDRDYQSVFLLQGTIELLGNKGRDVVSTVQAGTEPALHPLAHKQPRQLSARASGKVTVARIDSNLLDVLLTWDESAGYDVVEIDAQDDDDWMTRMLQSQAFLQLPPANIHQLLMRLESINASAGDTIVRQDEDGDYFYIVKSGRLAVTRKASARSKEVLLAELGEGACFGEDALVAGTKRNASVMMVTDGALMRLSKDDFNELLCEPLVNEVDIAEAEKLVKDGAQWLDVRLPGEFENQAIRGSTNLPLSALREQCTDLDSGTTFIVCCDTGRRSSAAAFVLSQRGFNVYALKNGMMDVPDAALTGGHPDVPQVSAATDAEIIPFEADTDQQAESVRNQPADGVKGDADSVLIDKIAESENEKIALQKQLDEAKKQLEATKTELSEAQGQLRDGLSVVNQARQDQESGQRRLESLQNENTLIQDELKRLRATLSQLHESADGRGDALSKELAQMAQRLDRQQQEHEGQLRETEQELGRVRDDYQQLGQRTSAVAGERDAAIKELEETRQRLTALQDQQGTLQAEGSEQLNALQQALENEKNQRASLQQQFNELETRHGELEQQNETDAAGAESAQTKNAELEEQLAASEQKLQEYGQFLQQAGERELALQERLKQAQQQAANELEQTQSSLSTERDELREQMTVLKSQLDAANRREQQVQQSIQQDEGVSRQLQKDLEQSRADAEDALKQLEQAKEQAAAAEKRAADLDSTLQAATSEHESDVSSVREAMARAQDERDNVQREHRRLLETLRKAERDLERTRHDHETEVLRLQKELKAAAGGSSAALADELEALQQQIKEGERLRDDVEIQLGERSAQLENEQAETEKLAQQLQQAQQSAREAEQQLIEANQVANEEMAVRLDTERQAQQALRDELAAVSAERNESQEQLTVQNQELEELRQATGLARAESDSHAGKLQALQDSVHRLEQALAEAQQARQKACKEVDQLRAEAEVTRSLVDMQAASDGDAALDEGLKQARKNVEVAVRLRAQAEEQAAGLQREVEHLQEELGRARSGNEQAGHIPSLDEDDPGASGLLAPDFEDQDEEDEVSVQAGVLFEEGEVSVTSARAETGSSGRWKGLLTGLLVISALASGAWWFVHSQPGKETDSRFESPALQSEEKPVVEQDEAGKARKEIQPEPVPPAADSAPSKVRAPKNIPPIAKGMSTAAETKAGKQAVAEIPVESVQETFEEPAKAQVEKPVVKAKPPAQSIQQPSRTFRDTLLGGGAAPVMVELRADSFTMGSGSTSPRFEERPRHRVKLSRFAISKHEVTFAQYDRFVQATGRARPADEGWGRGTRPVINVSWQDAVAYCQWLSAQTGAHYRLPTEAEWEFAARAGSNKRFWWGNEVGENHANCFDCGGQWSGSETARVGSFAMSPFALHDMAGNVMEWVQDCFQPGYANAPLDGSAVVTGDCSSRVVRGGSYSSPADLLRSASRDKRAPGAQLDNLGFRVVRQDL